MSAAERAWLDVDRAIEEGSAPTTSAPESARFRSPRVLASLRRAAAARPSWLTSSSARLRDAADGASRAASQRQQPTELAPFYMGPDGTFVQGDSLGDDAPEAPSSEPTDAQVATLWQRARVLLRELRDATRIAREEARSNASQAARTAADLTETGLRAIEAPLARAIEAVRTEVTRASTGVGVGFGLALLLGLGLAYAAVRR